MQSVYASLVQRPDEMRRLAAGLQSTLATGRGSMTFSKLSSGERMTLDDFMKERAASGFRGPEACTNSGTGSTKRVMALCLRWRIKKPGRLPSSIQGRMRKMGEENGGPPLWMRRWREPKASTLKDFCTFLEEVLKRLGPPVVPFYPFLGEGSPTTIDYRKNRIPLF